MYMFFSQDSTTNMLTILEQNGKRSASNTTGLKSDAFFGFAPCCQCLDYFDQTKMLPVFGLTAEICPTCRENPRFT